MSKISKTGNSQIVESMMSKIAAPTYVPLKTEPQSFTGEPTKKPTGWGRIELKNIFTEWLDLERSHPHLTESEYQSKMSELENKISTEISNMKESFEPSMSTSYKVVDETSHYK